mgnify:CR=1 FL=1
MDVTAPGTSADIDTCPGPSDGTGSDTEEITQPPCRAAELYVIPCPRCGRCVRLKTLRYSHVCGRNFNVQERANEQQIAAEAAINARMRSLAQTTAHCVQHVATIAPLVANKKDYSRLLNF